MRSYWGRGSRAARLLMERKRPRRFLPRGRRSPSLSERLPRTTAGPPGASLVRPVAPLDVPGQPTERCRVPGQVGERLIQADRGHVVPERHPEDADDDRLVVPAIVSQPPGQGEPSGFAGRVLADRGQKGLVHPGILAGLAKLGVYLYYLPAYSPELNRIEPVFKQVKHHDIPVRSYTSKADLRAAVEAGFDTFRQRLSGKSNNEPRLAA